MTNANASAVWDKELAKRGVKPSGESGQAEATAETEAQIAERIRNEEAQRHTDITAVCDLAGVPTRAAGFIASGKSLSETLTILSSASRRPKG